MFYFCSVSGWMQVFSKGVWVELAGAWMAHTCLAGDAKPLKSWSYTAHGVKVGIWTPLSSCPQFRVFNMLLSFFFLLAPQAVCVGLQLPSRSLCLATGPVAMVVGPTWDRKAVSELLGGVVIQPSWDRVPSSATFRSLLCGWVELCLKEPQEHGRWGSVPTCSLPHLLSSVSSASCGLSCFPTEQLNCGSCCQRSMLLLPDLFVTPQPIDTPRFC